MNYKLFLSDNRRFVVFSDTSNTFKDSENNIWPRNFRGMPTNELEILEAIYQYALEKTNFFTM